MRVVTATAARATAHRLPPITNTCARLSTQSGAVLLDGCDLQTLQLRWLRRQMGLVSQARGGMVVAGWWDVCGGGGWVWVGGPRSALRGWHHPHPPPSAIANEQEPALFAATIRENIAMGCPGASEAQVVAAATAAK